MKSRRPIHAGCALLIALALGLQYESRVAATPFPGPDDFGYTAHAIPGSLRDISGTGTFVPLADDQTSGSIALPFAFSFYNVSYTELFISSNGFVQFTNPNQGCCSGQPLPQNDAVNNVIAGYWEDLNLPQGNIRYETLGAAPNREFVVGYYSVHHYRFGPQVTFEIILHEGANAIELQYGAAPSDGGTHSVGIENAGGTIGLQIAFGNVSFNNEGFLISFHAPTAEITSVDAASCPIRTEMSIFDDEGHSLSGAVNVYDILNHYPEGLTEIRLELMHTACQAPLPTMNFGLNGTAVDSFEETVPQAGQPAPGSCRCDAGVETRTYDGPAALALWDSTHGATNTFELDRPVADEPQVAFAWARVVLSGPGQSDRNYCLFDFNGGNCDTADVCTGTFTWEEFSQDRMLGGDLNLVTSVPYTDSTLPSSVDLSGAVSPGILVELTATDGLVPVSTSVTIDRDACNLLTINNTPPVAACQDVTVPTDPGACSAAVASVDNGSSDLEGPVSLNQAPGGPYSLGDTPVTLTATDLEGLTDSCQATVTVVDQEAPVVSGVTASPNVLWPPNHTMVPVAIDVSAGDNCSLQCSITSVTSNEPINGLGDGDTAPDWVQTGPLSVNLRAERAGGGSGRVYTVGVACTDGSGNSTPGSVDVLVPHDQGRRR